MPRRTATRQRRLHLTTKANLLHKLGVNGFFADLAGHARTCPGADLTDWRPASAFHRDGAFCERRQTLRIQWSRVDLCAAPLLLGCRGTSRHHGS
jgi:hypothetical protein